MRSAVKTGLSAISGIVTIAMVVSTAVLVIGCGGAQNGDVIPTDKPVALAETSFLADIAQNVAGDRMQMSSILPEGSDPHSFDPTPQDAANVSKADVVMINSVGFEPPVDRLIASAGSEDLLVIDCSAGLAGAEVDPHFWLDPTNVITYVENIRAGITSIDPAGGETYAANAVVYRQRLEELDSWIVQRVAGVPLARRLLVTNHESFGRFAARYGFTVVGTILPSAETDSAPSAEGLAELAKAIEATGAPAIFVETGNNPALAEQLARETGVEVVTDLYTHSLGPGAESYVAMMEWNVDHIVEALQ